MHCLIILLALNQIAAVLVTLALLIAFYKFFSAVANWQQTRHTIEKPEIKKDPVLRTGSFQKKQLPFPNRMRKHL